ARIGHVDAAVVPDDQVVAAEPLGQDSRLATRVVGAHLLRACRDRVQPPIRAKGLAIASLAVRDKDADLAIEVNPVRLVVRDIVEEDLAPRVRRWSLGEPVAVAHELPVLTGEKYLLHLRRTLAGLDGRRPILPQPAHGIREDLRGMLAVVATGAPGVVDFVAGEGQGALHLLVRHPPVAAVDVLIAAPILEKDPKRFRLDLANQCGIDIAAAQPHISADGTEDAAEGVRPFPGCRERADRAAAGAANAAIIAIVRKPDG